MIDLCKSEPTREYIITNPDDKDAVTSFLEAMEAKGVHVSHDTRLIGSSFSLRNKTFVLYTTFVNLCSY